MDSQICFFRELFTNHLVCDLTPILRIKTQTQEIKDVGLVVLRRETRPLIHPPPSLEDYRRVFTIFLLL